ncbi:MAG: stage II sporulation protein R [Dethiobacter sp.]|jgi:stage II sporulation protein R|nr:stage II sporulation protein R [Dethiobacter sp.]MBS3902566.1 stage II sporulation protein R [Dethiobacter sp.]MBS3988685.1 stage II sporulation protein R [Dethiobacter sp.]
MQRRKVFTVVLSGMLLLSVLTYQAPKNQATPEDYLRLHVRAHSDAPSDQLLKYQVRDAVLAVLASHLAAAESLHTAGTKVDQSLPEVVFAAQQVVRQAGYDYTVRASLGEADFPTRLYGGQVYRAGRYQALQIYLGEGLGKNWWCVLFPPLCFVGVASDKAMPQPGQAAPPQARSRIIEWWRQLSVNTDQR